MLHRAVVFLLLSPALLLAQHEPRRTIWIIPAAVGLASAAALAGAAAVPAGAGDYGWAILPVASGAAGLIGGAVGGARADRALRRGEPLSVAHRHWMRAGLVLTGATAGAIVSLAAQPSATGTRRLPFMLGGTAAGAGAAWYFNGALHPRARASSSYYQGRTTVALRVAW